MCSKHYRVVFDLLCDLNIDEDDGEDICVCYCKPIDCDGTLAEEDSQPFLVAITSVGGEPHSVRDVPLPVLFARNIQVDKDVNLSMPALAASLFEEITSTEFEIK